jgi:hypothetical protein
VPISRVRDLQGTNDRLRSELEQLARQVTGFQGEAETARAAAGDAQRESLGNLRRALLAENRGALVEELVQGDTAEAITASVEAAKGAFNRATEAARRQLQRQQVPAGAAARDAGAATAESLSPTGKIAEGLRQRSSS